MILIVILVSHYTLLCLLTSPAVFKISSPFQLHNVQSFPLRMNEMEKCLPKYCTSAQPRHTRQTPQAPTAFLSLTPFDGRQRMHQNDPLSGEVWTVATVSIVLDVDGNQSVIQFKSKEQGRYRKADRQQLLCMRALAFLSLRFSLAVSPNLAHIPYFHLAHLPD